MTNSRQKGARGEREWAEFLTTHGFDARRGQQFAGGADSPDVVCPTLAALFHPEVKRVEALRLYPAMTQARGDAPEGRVPYVAHRTNRQDWVVIMTATDWLDLVRRAHGPR